MTTEGYDYAAIQSSIDHDAYHYGTGRTTPRTFRVEVTIIAPLIAGCAVSGQTRTILFQAGRGANVAKRAPARLVSWVHRRYANSCHAHARSPATAGGRLLFRRRSYARKLPLFHAV